jgi:hypothetical protein
MPIDRDFLHEYAKNPQVQSDTKCPRLLAIYDYGTGVDVTIRQEVIENELSTSGWVVIIGNETITAQAAHDIYRKKDVVEKAFLNYKNNLGMGRLRVHAVEIFPVTQQRRQSYDE